MKTNKERSKQRDKKALDKLPLGKSACHDAPMILVKRNGLMCRVCKKCGKPPWEANRKK